MPLRDLVAHKGHATAALLACIRQSEAASTDAELLGLLHHILIANRFWICAVRGLPFDLAREGDVPLAISTLAAAFRVTQEEEQTWISLATEPDCARVLTGALIPGGRCTAGEALLQVCLHGQGHRSQIAKMLRGRGVTPPPTDFILWRVRRPLPEWGPA